MTTTPTPRRSFDRRSFLRSSAAGGGALLLTAGGAQLLGACGNDTESGSDTTSGSGSANALAFQLGWLKGVQFGGHFAAVEQGYFAEVGVDPTFNSGGPNIDQISVVSSGQALLGDSGSDELVAARASGIPVVAVAAGFQKSPFSIMSLPDAPITTLEDMVGKSIAVSDGSRPQVESLLDEAGIDSTSVQFVPKNPDPSVLADGIVDGYTGFSTNEGVSLKLAGVDPTIVLFADLGAPTYANVLFTTDEQLAANRELILNFLRADVRGWQWAIENPAELAELVVADFAADGLELEQQTAEAEAQIELIDTGDATTEGLFWIAAPTFEANIEAAVEGGLIDAGISASDVFTQELIAEVHS